MKPIRVLLSILALVAVLIAAYQVWQAQTIVVQVASLTRGQFIESIELDGVAVATNRTMLLAPNNGQLSQIELQVGDEVVEGQVLAAMTSSPSPLLDIQSRKILLQRSENAKSQRRRADSDVSRFRKDLDDVLRRKGNVSTPVGQSRVVNPQLDAEEKAIRRELNAAEYSRDQALTEWNVYRIQLGMSALKEGSEALTKELTANKSKDANSKASNANDIEDKDSKESDSKADDEATSTEEDDSGLENEEATEIVAPYSSYVLQILRREAGPVAAGTPLIEVGDLENFEFHFDVLTEEVTKLRSGMRVTIQSPDADRAPVPGTIRSIGRVASKRLSSLGAEEMRTPVIVDVANGQAAIDLGDGYRVTGEFQTEVLDNVVKIPLGALYRKDEAWWVYRLEQGRARETKVEVLKQNDTEAAIKSGLGDHEMVVMYPSGRIQDGSKISVR